MLTYTHEQGHLVLGVTQEAGAKAIHAVRVVAKETGLPDSHLEDQKDLEYQEAHIKKIDTLNNSSLKNTSQEIGGDTLNPTSPTLPTHNLGDLESNEAKKEGMTEELGDLDHEDTPPRPTTPCPNCGRGDYWLREASQ